MRQSLAFYLFSSTCLINDIIHEDSCKILNIVADFQGSRIFDKSQNLVIGSIDHIAPDKRTFYV